MRALPFLSLHPGLFETLSATLEFGKPAAKFVSLGILNNVAVGAGMYKVSICADPKLTSGVVRCLTKGDLDLKILAVRLLRTLSVDSTVRRYF